MTTQPKTLLSIAGAPTHPAPLDQAALIVIDHQMEYVTGGVPLIGMEAATAEVRRLLDLARANNVPVFHVVHHTKPGAALFDPTGPYAEIIPGLEPVSGEATVVKSLPNSFAKTNLAELLAATGRRELILAGFATHMCISATTRAALDLGYRNTVVAAACATRDLPSPLGGVIPAATVHETALTELADRFAVVVPDSTVWRR